MFHCTLKVNVPWERGPLSYTYSLSRYHQEQILGTTHRKCRWGGGIPGVCIPKGWRAQDEKKGWWGVGQPGEKWEASIFSVRLPEKGGLSLLELLSGFLSSSLSTWRRLYSHPHNKLLPTSNQLYPRPVYGPPRVQWPSATVSERDPSIANLPAFRSESPHPVIGLHPNIS